MTDSDKELIYTVREVKPAGKHNVNFVIDITDEYTLQVMEKRYPGKLAFDGGRVFTMLVQVPIKGLSERNYKMWAALLESDPLLVSAFILERLRGNI